MKQKHMKHTFVVFVFDKDNGFHTNNTEVTQFCSFLTVIICYFFLIRVRILFTDCPYWKLLSFNSKFCLWCTNL